MRQATIRNRRIWRVKGTCRPPPPKTPPSEPAPPPAAPTADRAGAPNATPALFNLADGCLPPAGTIAGRPGMRDVDMPI